MSKSNPHINEELGQELLDIMVNSEDKIKEINNIIKSPQVDGALYLLYAQSAERGIIEYDGTYMQMTPIMLKFLMQTSCALGVYVRQSIDNLDSLWGKNTPEKENT